MSNHRALFLVLPLTLAACGKGEEAPPPPERDPAVTAALADPVTIDPDLANQNRGGMALGGGGPPSGEVPVERLTPEAVAAAKDAAAAELGGTIPPAPEAEASSAADPLVRVGLPEAIARGLPGVKPACLAGVQYGFIWAARLPAGLTPYPRADARLAGGIDAPGCRLRLTSFAAPVPVDDALAYHAALAAKAGYGVRHRLAGQAHVLEGAKGGARYAVWIEPAGDGGALVDIVTAGG